MLWIEFFVEEPSMETALIELVPKIIPESANYDFDIVLFRGKAHFRQQVERRLRAFSQRSDDWYVFLLLDRDRDDCVRLKQELEGLALNCGFQTRSSRDANKPYNVVTRIVVEELEAWFFGDVDALRKAYPRVSANLGRQVPYRNPDAIKGGTWEQMEKVLHYYHPGGLEKMRLAEEVTPHMQPERNRSHSFRVFRKALLDLFDEQG